MRPPLFHRAQRRRIVDAVEPQIRELLGPDGLLTEITNRLNIWPGFRSSRRTSSGRHATGGGPSHRVSVSVDC
jgi:hypothetical protein